MPIEGNIEIAGAGPGGLIAAINLARAGYDVTVYEEKSEVGRRFHGDFQGLENWSSEEDVTKTIKRLAIDTEEYPDLLCHPFKEVTVYDSKLKASVIQSKRPIFYLVKRGSTAECLDHSLMKAALNAGVDIKFNHRKDKLKDGGIVSVGPRAADVIAIGVTFKTSLDDMAVAIVDDNLAPKGYAYLLTCGGRGTIATVLFQDFKREKECFERTIEAFKKVLSFDMWDENVFGGFGNFFFNKPVFEEGKYFVGEAAGFQDCLWGFGMRYAMESGYLAAKSILEKQDYEGLLKKRLIPLQKASLVNRLFYTKLGNMGYSYIINIFAGGDAVSRLRRCYNPSFLKRLVYPIADWRYKGRLIDKGSHDIGCTCVWCRCGKETC